MSDPKALGCALAQFGAKRAPTVSRRQLHCSEVPSRAGNWTPRLLREFVVNNAERWSAAFMGSSRFVHLAPTLNSNENSISSSAFLYPRRFSHAATFLIVEEDIKSNLRARPAHFKCRRASCCSSWIGLLPQKPWRRGIIETEFKGRHGNECGVSTKTTRQLNSRKEGSKASVASRDCLRLTFVRTPNYKVKQCAFKQTAR